MSCFLSLPKRIVDREGVACHRQMLGMHLRKTFSAWVISMDERKVCKRPRNDIILMRLLTWRTYRTWHHKHGTVLCRKAWLSSRFQGHSCKAPWTGILRLWTAPKSVSLHYAQFFRELFASHRDSQHQGRRNTRRRWGECHDLIWSLVVYRVVDLNSDSKKSYRFVCRKKLKKIKFLNFFQRHIKVLNKSGRSFLIFVL